MKHKIYKFRSAIYLAVALLVAVPGFAQEGGGLDDVGVFRFGGKIGLGSADLSLAKFSKLGESRTTFSFGGFAEYRLFTWLSVNGGLEYTQNGGSNLPSRMFYINGSYMLYTPLAGGGSATTVRTNLRTHNLEIPITGRVSLPEMSGFKPFFLAGPSIGFRLGSKVTNYRVWDYGVPAANNILTATSEKVKEKTRAANFSLLFGLGSEFAAYGHIFEMGVTYRLGLVNQNNFFESLYQQYTSNSLMVFMAIKF